MSQLRKKSHDGDILSYVTLEYIGPATEYPTNIRCYHL